MDMKAHQIPFSIACSLRENKIVGHAIIDRKNKSIHLHLYGDMFGNKRRPIQVKQSGMVLTDGKEAKLITQILTDYFSDQHIEINKIERLNEPEELGETGHPLRIIIRLMR